MNGLFIFMHLQAVAGGSCWKHHRVASAQIACTAVTVRLASSQHRQIEIFVNFADVVLGRKHPMEVAMDRQPAVAFGIGTGGIKVVGGLNQLGDQFRGDSAAHRTGYPIQTSQTGIRCREPP